MSNGRTMTMSQIFHLCRTEDVTSAFFFVHMTGELLLTSEIIHSRKKKKVGLSFKFAVLLPRDFYFNKMITLKARVGVYRLNLPILKSCLG